MPEERRIGIGVITENGLNIIVLNLNCNGKKIERKVALNSTLEQRFSL